MRTTALLILLFAGFTAAAEPLRLTLMTGFLKDPEHPQPIEEWVKDLGAKFDARSLVSRAKKAGVSEIIWYDKWHDGLLFHESRTTDFHSQKDFLAELAPECKRQGARLVVYFNAFADGNPEFERWACRDQRGRPVGFGARWNCNHQSIFSPYRQKVLEQLREIVAGYDPDGVWLDAVRVPQMCFDRWSREAFEQQTGKVVEDSTQVERYQFSVDASSDWVREMAAFVRELKPGITVACNANPFFDPRLAGPRHFIRKGEMLDYLSAELHGAEQQEMVAPVLSDYATPSEGGILISSSWFTPIAGPAPAGIRSARQLQLEVARLFGTGLHVYLAIALAHDGTPDDATLDQLAVAGKWLDTRRAYLDGSRRIADVAIVMGTADVQDYRWPGRGGEREAFDPGWLGTRFADEKTDIYFLEAKLREAGYLTTRLTNAGRLQQWDSIPDGVRAVILPDRASLSPSDADRVRRFVRQGGTAVAFGRGSDLRVPSDRPRPDTLFGVSSLGAVQAAPEQGTGVTWGSKHGRLPLLWHVQPQTAEVVLWTTTPHEGTAPVLTVARLGEGRAYFSAAPELAYAGARDVLTKLFRHTIGEPVWTTEATTDSHLIRAFKKDGRRYIHVLKRADTRDQHLRLRINREVLPFAKATVVPDDYPLTVEAVTEGNEIEIYPSPELLIALE